MEHLLRHLHYLSNHNVCTFTWSEGDVIKERRSLVTRLRNVSLGTILKHSPDSDFSNSLLTWFSAYWCYPAHPVHLPHHFPYFARCGSKLLWWAHLCAISCEGPFDPVQRLRYVTQLEWFEIYLMLVHSTFLLCLFAPALNYSFNKDLPMHCLE